MTTGQEAGPDVPRVVSASREIGAPAEVVFELIADPARQPAWDGNNNLAHAGEGQRVRRAGDVFTMTLTSDMVRENHVTEFEEGRLIAWTPSAVGEAPPGHIWRWELAPVGTGNSEGAAGVLATLTYDWTALGPDPKRLERARATTAGKLQASLGKLAALAESNASATAGGAGA
jgi:uncharacterized protein YndB with AHSA1/START domain